MSYVIIAMLVAFIVINKFYLEKIKKNERDDLKRITDSVLPYKKKEYLFSKAEKSFYEILKLVLKDDEYSIFAKVRLCDLIYIPNNTKDRQSFWNRIKSKHVDFIICDSSNICPILAIELDDSSHNSPDRVERDIFVNKALTDAGLSIMRVKVSFSYDINELSEIIYSYLNPAMTRTLQHNIASSEIAAGSEADHIPSCPKCRIPMVLRTAKKGDNAGNVFYGCANFPKCREIINI